MGNHGLWPHLERGDDGIRPRPTNLPVSPHAMPATESPRPHPQFRLRAAIPGPDDLEVAALSRCTDAQMHSIEKYPQKAAAFAFKGFPCTCQPTTCRGSLRLLSGTCTFKSTSSLMDAATDVQGSGPGSSVIIRLRMGERWTGCPRLEDAAAVFSGC